MELLALNEGLKICEDYNYTHIGISTDFKRTIKMLNNGNQFYNGIIDNCRFRLIRLGCPVVNHNYREQNMVADVLAKHGATTNIFEQPLILAVPPVYAR